MASAQETFFADDAGQPRQFELALDELAVSTPTARRVLTTTGKATSATEQRRAATRLTRDTGGQAELVVYEVVDGARRGTPRFVTVEVLFTVAPGADAEGLALQVGAASVKPTFVENTWIAVAADSGAAIDLAAALRALPGVVSANPLLARQQSRKLVPNDTFFTNQWHLRNTGQFSGVSGTDIRVTNVWDTYRGAGQVIAIIDDGLQTAHPDLSANVNTTIDYDINYSDGDPSPDIAGDDHGTACAGVAAARGNNSVGVSGSAPEATLVGLRLISIAASDSEEAQAINWSNSLIHIKSNSWGPSDDGATLEAPGTLTAAALSNACAVSRGGRGALIFWAGGNGGENDADDSNYDGYANSIYSIAIAAVCNSATSSWYSESGANIVVAAPSSGDNTLGNEIGIWTVDRTGADGYNDGATSGEPTDANYTATFGGTSSATPLAAGVGALVLQANTNLGWRDVQEIFIRSATRIHPTDNDWRTNSAGIAFNHKYGGGLISASGAVAMASTWTNLGAQISTSTNQSGLSVAIPDNSAAGVTRTFTVTNTLRVEHAVVTLSATHPYRGDLKVEIISPSGMTSVVGAVRGADSNDNFSAWNFMSVRHWGEPAAGTWTVRVADRAAADTGTLTALGLTFYGAGAALADQPPVLAPIGNKSVVHSNTLMFAVSATDPVDGDAISLVASNMPAGATFGVTNGNGTFTWVNAGPLGATSVTFHAWDNDGYDSETITVTVNDGSCVSSNLLTENFDASTSLPAGWSGSGSANDTAATHLQSSPNCRAMGSADTVITPAVRFPTQIMFYVDSSAGGAGQSGTIEYAVDGGAYASLGSFTVSEAGASELFALTTSPDLSASTNVTFRFASTFSTWYLDDVVIDGACGGGAPPAQVAPVLAAIGAKSVTVSNQLTFAVSATDANSDPITLVISNLPVGATFPVTNGNGTFIWTNAAPTGTYSVTFHAFDDDGFDAETIAITVTAAPSSGATGSVVFAESMGTSGTSGNSIAVHESNDRFDNDNFTMSGTGDMRNTSVSSGYADASGSFNVMINAVGETFQILGIDVFGRTSMALSFGVRKGTTAEDGAGLIVEASTNGTEWTQVSPVSAWLPTGTGTATWHYRTNAIPDSLATSNLYVRFRTTNSVEWRIDDLKLTGDAGGVPDPDFDDDGIDDAWETNYFASLTNVSATSDWDNDGFIDLHEFLAGSNPTNEASLLEATSAASAGGAGGFIVTWQSESNRNYMLARSTNLLEGFVGIASNIPAVYPLNTYTDAVAPAANSAYRVELE
jgi:kexin